MNANGMARGYLSKSAPLETFVNYVFQTIERELSESFDNVQVRWSSKNEDLTIFANSNTFEMKLTETTAQKLQNQSPYSLDRYIWSELKSQGMQLQDDHYMRTVFR